MLLGTSGVGKTETAKILNKELYKDEQNIIRFDMSEYQKEHEVSKLIGLHLVMLVSDNLMI